MDPDLDRQAGPAAADISLNEPKRRPVVKREHCEARHGWQKSVESLGFTFHTSADGAPYWDETVYYAFTPDQVAEIEKATYELDRMCLEAVEHVIRNQLWSDFSIPETFGPWIAASWETEPHTIIGRFDLAYSGVGPPKMLEYNADTPTSLLEAAVIQWYWYQDKFGASPDVDQFNNIHERLVEAWARLRAETAGPVRLTFLTMEDIDEDSLTTAYLRDTAVQGGWITEQLDLESLGFDAYRKQYIRPDGEAVELAFKLYPWEWMLSEKFGAYLTYNTTRWLEAPWKMILSNKALLPLLSRLFPESPYLLAADTKPIGTSWVRKPIFGREGSNVTVCYKGVEIAQSGGDYSEGPYIYQEYAELSRTDGYSALVGSWMVNGYACGIGIREDSNLIMGNLARFVPHVIVSS